MDAIGISLTGLQTSMARFSQSAARVADASASPAPAPDADGRAPQSATPPPADVIDALVQQMQDKLTYDANLTALRTGRDMERSLLNPRWG